MVNVLQAMVLTEQEKMILTPTYRKRHSAHLLTDFWLAGSYF
jgi:alpha-L-arabinofuranosidase